MRSFTMEVACAMGAAEFWQLKYDFEMERAAARAGGRVLNLKSETRGTDADDNVTVTRVVDCTFSENPVPPALRKMVDSSKADSEVNVHWRPHVWDASHPCHTVIRLPHFEKIISISSKQWLLERTASACTICARVHIDCRAMGVGGLVESAIEKDMRKAFEAFPLRVIAYKNGIKLEKQPTPAASPILLMADRAPPLPRKFQMPPLDAVTAPRPQRWRLRLRPLRRAPATAKSTRVSSQDDEDRRAAERTPLGQRLAQLCACSGWGPWHRADDSETGPTGKGVQYA